MRVDNVMSDMGSMKTGAHGHGTNLTIASDKRLDTMSSASVNTKILHKNGSIEAPYMNRNNKQPSPFSNMPDSRMGGTQPLSDFGQQRGNEAFSL